MDPNESLRECRLRLMYVYEDIGDGFPCTDSAERLADAFRALDEWLSKGGFLPEDWSKR